MRRWGFLTAVMVTYGLMAAIWLLDGPANPEVAKTASLPSATADLYTCVEVGTDNSCRRQVEDLRNRRPITGEQRTAAQAAGVAVVSALPPVPNLPPECRRANGPCAIRPAPIDDAHIAAARAAIAVSRYPATVVRLARDGDPAPIGSLIYGVEVGDACVIGYQRGDGGSHWAAGKLRDGSCLSPQ